MLFASLAGRGAEPSSAPLVQEVVKPGAIAAGATRPRLREPLMVGATSDSFSYSFINRDGELDGFSVDLLNAIARTMNLKIQRTIRGTKETNDLFVQGEFDLLQAYSESATRVEFADFTVPYLTLQGAVFVRRRDNPVQKFQDLAGRTFALVGVGSIGEDFLRAHGLKCRIISTNSFTESLRLVQSGQADATFGSRLSVLSVVERENFNNIVQLEGESTEIDLRIGFAVHKGDAVLLARLNEGLAVLRRTGEYDRIYQKWFDRFDPPMFTSQQVLQYAAGVLGIGFLLALWGFLRQRALGKRIAGQAAQLAEKEELLRALYENVPVAMCIIEAAPEGHRLITLNPRAGRLFELPIDSNAGRRLDELRFCPEWSAVLADTLRHWPTRDKITHHEHALTAPRRTIVLTLVPLAPGANGFARVCVLTEDITERRRFDEELAQTRKLRAVGELVGGIAHEFNNLLTPIMLKASELQVDRGHDGKLQQDVHVISRAVQRAAELTRRLLTFGRKSENRAESVGLASVVVGAFDLLRPTMDRRIVWENAVPANLPPLYFNSTDLNQILVNLLLNARDTLEDKIAAHPPASWTPHIRVEAVHLPPEAAQLTRRPPTDRPLLGWQRLSVRDGGLGITAAARERIFEPFYTTKPVGRGTGLGLATVWHVTTQAGGRVEVESTPGEGTVFHVMLPVWPMPKIVPKPTPANGSHSVNIARVLVVEDEELVALTIVAALKRSGHQVYHLTNGLDGWEHLAPNPGAYDLLMIDVNLPGIDGIEFARRARAANFPGRILISSGRLTAHQLQSIGQLQVDRVLPKPFNLEEFQTAVRDCLATRAVAEPVAS
ncbi:MAG: transporter substrate-binding domain-containing protein [Opitutaceae bacterium]